MDTNLLDFVLPQAPQGVCFDRNDFVKTNFSVDTFLTEHQNVATLEIMRDDLGAYLKVLRLAMIELINKDYANFVNLCATLIGFDKTVLKIQSPLTRLNEEVLSVQQSLETAMKELSMWLHQRHSLQKKKQSLKYYSQTINCLKTLDNVLQQSSEKPLQDQIVIAERAAMQYNQLKYSIAKCDGIVKIEQKNFYNELGGKLVQTVNELLFQFWNNNDEDNLLKTLMTLSLLNRVTETEMLIRKQAISPLLKEVINESVLKKKGLKGIFEELVSLLNTKLKLLFNITQHPKLTFSTTNYRFLVNCFWCEVESRIEVNLSSIFAPGNPQVFFTRYNESMEFVRSLERYCAEDMVKVLKQTDEYKSFLRRWNLPVYFQIRFQEIAGSYEGSLQSPTIDPHDGFTLRETRRCWQSVITCWSEGVYIEALAHKFWKLSLQLLARYCSWAGSYSTQTPSQKAEPTSINKTLIDNNINIYGDLQSLIQRLPELLQIATNKIPKNSDILKKSLHFTEVTLQGTKKTIQESVVKELFGYYNVQLKQVSDIPRLYRKTNRSVPSKPCAYIDVVGNSLREFKEDAGKRLDNQFLGELFEALFNVMTVSYYKYVEDVLTSVQKTEESLRRLKQIRERGAQQTTDSAGVTDGDKIRLQLNVDVMFYGKTAEMLHVNVDNIHKFTELRAIVTESVKNIDIK